MLKPQPLVTPSVTLFGTWIIANVVFSDKVIQEYSGPLIQYDYSPSKKQEIWTQTCAEGRPHENAQTHRDKLRPCDDRGRDCSDTAACQGTPGLAGHHQKLEEARKDSTRVSEGAWPCQQCDFGLLASRTRE